MSGGSLDYIYSKVEDAAREISMRGWGPTFSAFAKHLVQVSKVLKDVEWAMSCDISKEEAEETIKTLLGPVKILESVIGDALTAKKDLEDAIEAARSRRG